MVSLLLLIKYPKNPIIEFCAKASLYFRYLIHNGSYSPTSLAPHRQDWLVTCVDILVFTVFCVQVMTISTFLFK